MSQATTFTVDISGGGDFLEIQPAVNAATLGDTILVAPGRYAGEIKFFAEKEGISLIGTGGPAAAKVVGDTIGIGIWEATEPVLIENLEIREVGGFGGLYTHASRVIVRNCVLRENNGPGNCIGVGGGARVMFGSDVTFTDCLIENNTGWESPGGMIIWDSRADITGCTFKGNEACYGGGLEFYHCGSGYSDGFEPSVCEYNLFIDNSVVDVGGAVMSLDSSPIIRFNTMVNNTSSGGTALWLLQGQPIVANNVITGSDQPISCAPFETIPAGNPVFGLNLVWGNDGPAVTVCPDTGDILAADPGFCDAEAGVFTVCTGSPCLDQEEQLGAFGEGCVECLVPVSRTSLGGVKSLFR